MTSVNHEAFLDLEAALTGRLEASMVRTISPTLKKIEAAVAAGDFIEAERLVGEIDVTPAIDKNHAAITTVGTASLLLGVSRVSPIRESQTFSDMPDVELANAIEQTEIMLTVNTNADLQKRALELINQTEAIISEQTFVSSEEDDDSFSPTAGIFVAGAIAAAVAGSTTERQAQKLASKAIRIIVNNNGKQFMALGTSLMVSRISALGFMQEATAKGITTYVVNEILDSRTCPVCQAMHGKRFPVKDGLLHTSAVLATDDPELIRVLAPWPNQSRQGVEELKSKSNPQLIAEGLHLPPYHPACRGIVTVE